MKTKNLREFKTFFQVAIGIFAAGLVIGLSGTFTSNFTALDAVLFVLGGAVFACMMGAIAQYRSGSDRSR
jgi:tetrahydromethanopterin S-methyltransferase subunit C